MSVIEIPYLPISGFNETEVCDKIEKTFQEGKEGFCDNENHEIVFPEEGNGDKDVLLILHGIGMEKYFRLFQELEIPLDTFLQLNEYDLQEIGIVDPNDRETILKSLHIHKINLNEIVVSENHFEDLRIAKNVLNQLLLLQNYCAYLDLQMKRHELNDYRISWKETACSYLNAFIRSAITQCKILSCSLFNEGHSDHLIGKIIQVYNIPLPEQLHEKVKIKKKHKRHGFFKVMVVVGFCSMALLTGKCLVKAK